MAETPKITVRLLRGEIAALDAIAAEHEAVGIAPVSRSDVLRKMIEDGLAAHAAARRAASPARARARHRTL